VTGFAMRGLHERAMKRKARRGALSRGGLLSFVAVAAACGRAPQARVSAPESGVPTRLEALVAERPQARRTALLVGLDRYAPGASARFPTLRGCANDVRRMERVLTERFGFDPRDVFVLLDEEATHRNVVTAFARVLIERAAPDTEALFFLAGHGSRVPDRASYERAEPDRLDSTYVAHDSRAVGVDGEHDLSDDELRCLVQALCARTPRVTVITDTCHSGGVLRGGAEVATRAVPAGTRPLDFEWARSFWPAGVALSEDGPRERLDPERYVHVAACRRDQSAFEYRVEGEDGRPVIYGALTHFLCQGLERAHPGDTWRTLLGEVAARLATEVPAQSLTCRGALERELFGGGFRHLSGVEARALPDGAVVVQAGSLYGLRPGSILRVLDARAEEVLGRIRVERVAGTSARAAWIEGGAGDTRALRAVEEAHPGARPPLSIAAPEPEVAAWLSPRLGLELVSADAADYRLARTRNGLLLETVEGVPVAGPIRADASGAEPLAAAIEREQRWRSLFALGARRGTYPLEARFRAPTAGELLPGWEAVPLADGPAPERFDGELGVVGAFPGAEVGRMAMLEVRNPHDRELYVYVLSVAEDRYRNPIDPAPGELAERLAPGGAETVPVAVLARRDWPLDRPMRDRYLVIATTRRADFGIFAAEGTVRGGGERAFPPTVLHLALEESVPRGVSVTAGSVDWGVTAVDLLVEPPERRARRAAGG